MELDDWDFEISLPGPVKRILRSGADAYVLADSMENWPERSRRGATRWAPIVLRLKHASLDRQRQSTNSSQRSCGSRSSTRHVCVSMTITVTEGRDPVTPTTSDSVECPVRRVDARALRRAEQQVPIGSSARASGGGVRVAYACGSFSVVVRRARPRSVVAGERAWDIATGVQHAPDVDAVHERHVEDHVWESCQAPRPELGDAEFAGESH